MTCELNSGKRNEYNSKFGCKPCKMECGQMMSAQGLDDLEQGMVDSAASKIEGVGLTAWHGKHWR